MALALAASMHTNAASLAVPWMTPPPAARDPSAVLDRNCWGRPSSLPNQSMTICACTHGRVLDGLSALQVPFIPTATLQTLIAATACILSARCRSAECLLQDAVCRMQSEDCRAERLVYPHVGCKTQKYLRFPAQ